MHADGTKAWKQIEEICQIQAHQYTRVLANFLRVGAHWLTPGSRFTPGDSWGLYAVLDIELVQGQNLNPVLSLQIYYFIDRKMVVWWGEVITQICMKLDLSFSQTQR